LPAAEGGAQIARRTAAMLALLQEIRRNALLWLLPAIPLLFATEWLRPQEHAWLFVWSVLALIPLAALLTVGTESVAARTGDTIGGLVNATFGNLAEMIIALTALAAGQYLLVKATIAGAIITKTLLVLGLSFTSGGLAYHLQEFNRGTARLQAGLLFLATVALLFPSMVIAADAAGGVNQTVSVALAFLLIPAYVLSLVFTLGTHRKQFGDIDPQPHAAALPMLPAVATLAVATVLIALVSELFVESVQHAAEEFGMTPAFVGLVIVSLVGGSAEMLAAVSAARKNRLDMSIGIALGSSSQIALFVAPVLVLLSYALGPQPMDLRFWPGAVAMMLIATTTAAFVTNRGQSAWFMGVLVVNIYLVFALTMFFLPPPAP
jgi:Ca2+:H+ antiporter